jgi:cell division septation protein DedD
MKEKIVKSLILATLLLLLSVSQHAVSDTETIITDLRLLASEERIPQTGETVISPDDIIPPIGTTASHPEGSPPGISPVIPSSDFSPFNAPLIAKLEQGRWYVQIGAYRRPDHVEDEITHLGTDYPVIIQNIGTDLDPLFRVLIGPYSREESIVVMQRLRNNRHKDAFLRTGD